MSDTIKLLLTLGDALADEARESNDVAKREPAATVALARTMNADLLTRLASVCLTAAQKLQETKPALPLQDEPTVVYDPKGKR